MSSHGSGTVILLLVMATAMICAAEDVLEPSGPDVEPETNNRIRVRAKLLRLSTVPDPNQSTYENCICVAEVELIEGRAASHDGKLLFGIMCFENRELTPAAAFEEGDSVEAVLIPFSEAGEVLLTTQTFDEIMDFDLPFYFVLEIQKAGAQGFDD